MKHRRTGAYRRSARAALGLEPPERWLTQRSPAWVIARMVDQFVPPGQQVWSTMPVAEAYATSEILVNYFSAEGELLEDILLMPARPKRNPHFAGRSMFPVGWATGCVCSSGPRMRMECGALAKCGSMRVPCR